MSLDREDLPATTCFLHVPKGAGSSVYEALARTLPAGSLAPRRGDLFGFRIFSDFARFETLDEQTRLTIALSETELGSLSAYRAVAGHYALSSLLRITPPSRIATVLREPRARLLSLYLYFRIDAPVRALWGPLGSPVLEAAMRPLESFLAERSVANATDNQVCRMLLDGDSRIPARDFIDPADVEDLAAAALERLDRFGFVGIMESGQAAWDGLSRFFEVPLEPVRINATGARNIDSAGLPVPAPEPGPTLDLIERRSAADRIVYEAVWARACGGAEAARQRAEDAFVAQVERFGAVAATPVRRLAGAAAGGSARSATVDVQRIVTGPLRANCYLVSAPSGDAMVIDPGDQFELIDGAIAAGDVEVHAVLCTHAHYDHLGAAAALCEKYEAPFHLHEDDAPLLRRVNLFHALVKGEEPIPIPRVDVTVHDSALLRFGALEARVVHTPGHSPGSVCIEIGGELFTGDTVVSGRPGRTDLPGGSSEALEASLRRLAGRFDPATTLHPGHGGPLSLAEVVSGGFDLSEPRDEASLAP